MKIGDVVCQILGTKELANTKKEEKELIKKFQINFTNEYSIIENTNFAGVIVSNNNKIIRFFNKETIDAIFYNNRVSQPEFIDCYVAKKGEYCGLRSEYGIRENDILILPEEKISYSKCALRLEDWVQDYNVDLTICHFEDDLEK